LRYTLTKNLNIKNLAFFKGQKRIKKFDLIGRCVRFESAKTLGFFESCGHVRASSLNYLTSPLQFSPDLDTLPLEQEAKYLSGIARQFNPVQELKTARS
jgi:hypothetical protein